MNLTKYWLADPFKLTESVLSWVLEASHTKKSIRTNWVELRRGIYMEY
jgi:hypothetical protein